MAIQVFPTKGNLIAIKKQLQLAKLGYELLDRKRNIILREMLAMAEVAIELQEKLNVAYEEAYTLLQYANFTTGQKVVMEICNMVPVQDLLTIRYKSVMGIEIPEVIEDKEYTPELNYSIGRTNSYVDQALIKFNVAKSLAAKQAALENSIYRLAYAIKQAQKRANALKNIVIPRFEGQISYIQSYLEEKEREEFTAMKMVKSAII